MAFVFELPEVGRRGRRGGGGVVERERVGDYVEVDQPLCEITTDKAQLEISSPKAGQRASSSMAQPGDIIKVHCTSRGARYRRHGHDA